MTALENKKNPLHNLDMEISWQMLKIPIVLFCLPMKNIRRQR